LNNSRKRSNRGGFQTEISDPFILNTLLQQSIFMLKKSMELPDTKVSIDAWINENNKGDYNSLHSHIGANYSGTYYVKIPKKDGELVFKRDPAVLWTRNQDIINNNETSNSWILKPSKNLFVLFSSHIEHMVVPHNDDESRISVSFNIRLTKDG
jgi:uncharacterized protein (TIGR02466 family)